MAETQSLDSLLSYLKGMTPKKLARKIGQLDAKTADSLLHVWELLRQDRAPPPGDWLVWLVMGGRGSGGPAGCRVDTGPSQERLPADRACGRNRRRWAGRDGRGRQRHIERVPCR